MRIQPDYQNRISPKPDTMNESTMTCDPVESYFNSIGIRNPKSDAVFLKNGKKRFGKAFEEMMSVITGRANGHITNPYDLKNSSLAPH